MKRNKTLPLAVSEDDLKMLDRCRAKDTAFKPERSPLGCALLRYAMDRLLSGDVTIQHISDVYAASPISGAGEVSR